MAILFLLLFPFLIVAIFRATTDQAQMQAQANSDGSHAGGSGMSGANGGYVYVLVNPSFDHLVKIGKTIRDPRKRVAEISAATGVPTPFALVHSEWVPDCDSAERRVHEQLQQFRHNKGREFFSVTVAEAIATIRSVKIEQEATALSVQQTQATAGRPLHRTHVEQRFQAPSVCPHQHCRHQIPHGYSSRWCPQCKRLLIVR